MVCFLHVHHNMNSLTSNLYQQLLDNQSTAVLLLNAALRVVYMNSAAEALLETSGARVQGLHLGELFTEQASSLSELKAALTSGASFTKRQTRLILHQHSELTVDYTVTPINSASPHLLIEIFPRDRWLRISREENLLGQQEASRLLIRGLAHEIKNPLGGIRGAAQLLARELAEAHLAEYTDIIIAEADRLRGLVDQMLGPIKQVAFSRVNIHEVLEHVARLVERESGGELTITRDYDPSLPELTGNKEQLIQAFLNVTRNAMRAVQHHQAAEPGAITITSRAARQITLANRRHRMV